MSERIFLDGNPPGCRCTTLCSMPCWQRVGLTEQRCCDGCPPLPVPRDQLPDTEGERMTVTPFDRTTEQRMDALEHANDIRIRRARLKRQIKTGEKRLEDVLPDPPEWLGTAKVYDLLMVVPGFGAVKVNRLLVNARISPSKTVGGMTPRQRNEIARRLADWSVRRSTAEAA